MLADGSALVCWLEKLPTGGEVRMRRVKPDGKPEGKLDAALTVSTTGAARSNGFPQMARAGNTLVFAWTGLKVMTAALTLAGEQ